MDMGGANWLVCGETHMRKERGGLKDDSRGQERVGAVSQRK